MTKDDEYIIDDKDVWKKYVKENEIEQSSSDQLMDLAVWEEYKKFIEERPFPEDQFEEEIKTKLKFNKSNSYKNSQSVSNVLDLHHMTQDQAYESLKIFLHSAQLKNIKKVIIITGKGERDKDDYWKHTGVLKKLVPRWFCEMPFKKYVLSTEQASQSKGGIGALIVYLKKI